MRYIIDINCDVGEGVGNEAELFPYISSCNIACGGHAGDIATMAAVVQLAKQHHVKIGAHPAYPDIANFGRVSLKIDPNKLINSIQKQIEDLVVVCDTAGVTLHHIKAHGALYNDIAKDAKLAAIFLEAVAQYKGKLKLYVPSNSICSDIALDKGFAIIPEAFADRNYTEDLRLVSRTEPNALLTDPKEVLEHLLLLITEQQVLTISEKKMPITAATFCVHGDTASAFEILVYLSNNLPKHHIFLAK